MSGKKTLKAAMTGNLISTLILLGIGVACTLVGLLIKFAGNFGIIIKGGLLLLGVSFILAALGMVTFVRSRAKKNYCKSCGEKYDYNRDVEWTEESEENTGRAIYSYVAVHCVCNNCGEERHFNRRFRTAFIDEKGNKHYYQLEDLIRKAFTY